MATNSNNLGAKTSKNEQELYICETCNYICYKKFNYDRHLLSSKHKKSTLIITQATQNEQIEQTTSYKCENCNKVYKDRTGLWRHKKTCNNIIETNVKNAIITADSNKNFEEITALKDLMKYLMKENSEMKNLMMEQQNLMMEHQKQQSNMMLKVIETGTINNSHNITNSHNKAFNLNFFLNETCKEAMNIGDFVDSLKIQLSDLEKVGESGYIEGISSIIVKNLKELDVTKRPVHCTDKKRETIYIKDNNVWEKDEDKSKMHKLIKKVVSKNVNMFAKYREIHPDCKEYYSKYNDQYQKIIYESMGGKGDDDVAKNEKIIKNVLKEVVVDKNI